jgi:predicted alpha/beta superfamily hydrolase
MKHWLSTIGLTTAIVATAAEKGRAPTGIKEVLASAVTAQTFTMESVELGETRRINVYLPGGYKEHADALFPVLYIPDGGMAEDFPHVVDTIEAMSSWGTMRAVMVVGIENTQRRRDMTGPTEVETDKKIAPSVGGSAAFRRFIRKELMPEIRARYRVNSEKGIAGESLAGLFVVETFLLEPDLFDTYIAISASLWWNKESLVKSAGEHLKSLTGHKTLYLTCANEEDIVRGTQRIADLLKTSAPEGLTWFYHPMPEQFHDTIYRAASPKAFRVVYPPPPKEAH